MIRHFHRSLSRRDAFSIVELLVVITLVAILSAIAVPAFLSISSGSGMKKAITGVSDALEMARTDAMATSTWIWVGIADTTADNPSKNPQITIATVASRDGTTNTAATNLIQRNKPLIIDNVTILTNATTWGTNATVAKGSSFQFVQTVAGLSKTFTNTVIGFSPQGEAVLSTAAVSSWLEVGVREMRGSTPIPSKTASIQVSGVSGQVVVTY